MSVTQKPFGTMPGGEETILYTITNRSGASASIASYGATWQAMRVPDRTGDLRDVVLGYDTLDGYRQYKNFLGATIGRVANRIGKARFTLNGREYRLAANNGEACLHGGREGFDKKVWKAAVEEDAVVFSLCSPDGDEGFPGSLSVMVIYSLTEDNALSIRYFAVTDADTIVNLTNHAYFNLGGHVSGTILEQTLQVNAASATRIDERIVPTGEIVPVAGGPLDFRAPKPFGRDIESLLENIGAARGFDHNFVLDHPKGGVEKVARAFDPNGGVWMDVFTDQPGVQLFTPYDFKGMVGKGGVEYGFRPAFCLETQHFADAMAHPEFPSIVLHAGEIYASETIYKFGADK